MDKLDRERIFAKLDEMVRYIQELQDMLPNKKEYLQNLIIRRACEKTIEIAIEMVIDVSAMIISAEKFGLPSSEENIFEKLVEYKAIDKELGEKLKDMKGFRNILIHRYADIDDEIVFENLRDSLDDFLEFKKVIEVFLEKNRF